LHISRPFESAFGWPCIAPNSAKNQTQREQAIPGVKPVVVMARRMSSGTRRAPGQLVRGLAIEQLRAVGVAKYAPAKDTSNRTHDCAACQSPFDRRQPVAFHRAGRKHSSDRAEESEQGKRRARRQGENCKTQFPAGAAAASEAVWLLRNPLGGEICGHAASEEGRRGTQRQDSQDPHSADLPRPLPSNRNRRARASETNGHAKFGRLNLAQFSSARWWW
jgi:hypothetical protein